MRSQRPGESDDERRNFSQLLLEGMLFFGGGGFLLFGGADVDEGVHLHREYTAGRTLVRVRDWVERGLI